MKEVRGRAPVIEGLVAEILASAPKTGCEQIAAWKNPRRDLSRLARRDYVKVLQRTLSFGDLKDLLKLGRRLWPNLNRSRLSAAPQRSFPRMAGELTSTLRLHLQASPYRGPEGMALRGFYVEPKERLLKRPLIFVNTAHHPVAVSSTFCHELGHHLTAQLFDAKQHGVHFFFDADYAAHLDDPIELAADVLVSLGAYPKPIARKLFASPWNWGAVARTGTLDAETLAKIRSHVEGNYGAVFSAPLPVEQRLNYLAGMIHYAKLRWAILAEYDL